MAARKYLIQGTPELPATLEEWNSARKITHKMSTNDAIEMAHLALVKEKNGVYLDTIKGRTNAEAVKARKGPLSKTQYRLVERCLHPDNSASAELRSEAFQMFRGKKLVLVAENEAPTESPTVPTTVAEWEEMKRKASR